MSYKREKHLQSMLTRHNSSQNEAFIFAEVNIGYSCICNAAIA